MSLSLCHVKMKALERMFGTGSVVNETFKSYHSSWSFLWLKGRSILWQCFSWIQHAQKGTWYTWITPPFCLFLDQNETILYSKAKHCSCSLFSQPTGLIFEENFWNKLLPWQAMQYRQHWNSLKFWQNREGFCSEACALSQAMRTSLSILITLLHWCEKLLLSQLSIRQPCLLIYLSLHL